MSSGATQLMLTKPREGQVEIRLRGKDGTSFHMGDEKFYHFNMHACTLAIIPDKLTSADFST